MFEHIWTAEKYDFKTEDDVIDKLLQQRGIISSEAKYKYFNMSEDDLSDPFELSGMDEAVERIIQAQENGEKVMIFGDYDADGVTSTALLYDFMKNQLEMDVLFKLPSRFGEGYGLSKNAIKKAADDGVTLIVTVDNGISLREEIWEAEKFNIDVVVTDHHDLPPMLPECTAVVNPKLDAEDGACRNLCGCGVAFKLVQAISFALGMDDYLKYLPIAAIGTIGDMVKLVDENRLITYLGMKKMNDRMYPALNVLLSTIKGQITSTAISYGVIPKLNAPGRIGDADIAVEFLLSDNEEKANEILKILDGKNNERKKIVDEIVKEIIKEPKKFVVTDENSSVFVAKGDNWHKGVLGIVSAQMLEKFHKPCIVFTNETSEDGISLLAGSARSIDGINIADAFNEIDDTTEKHGGHEKAAGITIKAECLPEFVKRLSAVVDREADKIKKVKVEKADIYLPGNLLSLSLWEKISRFEPFGEGNKAPVFLTDDFRCAGKQVMGPEKNLLKYSLANSLGECFDFVPWNKDFAFMNNCFIGSFAVVYKLEINEFNGKKSVQLKAEDFIERMNSESVVDAFRVTRDELMPLYGLVRNAKSISSEEIAKIRNSRLGKLSWFKIKWGMKIFQELDFIEIIVGEKDLKVYNIKENPKSRQLSESFIYREIGG